MAKKTETSNFMYQLRLIVLDNYKDKKVLETPVGRYIRKELDSDRLIIVRELTELLMETDYLSEESKVFLSIPYINYQGVVDEIYINSGRITNANNVQSRVWYDKDKLVKELGGDLPIDVLEYMSRDVRIYLDRIANLRLKLSKADLLKGVELKFPRKTVYCDSILDEEFEEFLNIIAPYTKKCMSKVANGIDEKVLGYIRYITTHKNLSDTDKKRYNDLKELIGY